MSTFILIVYLLTVTGLAVYGLLGLLTLLLYWRHRHETFPCPPLPPEPPRVTVQLPIYNEQFVVKRLIEAAVSLNYPLDKLQIQVVDDSQDATTQRAAALVQQYQTQGVDIELVRRTHRNGYKAGALQNALQTATGEFIALFDADFKPDPTFLRQTIPYFVHKPTLGMVQTRWGHLNDANSALTAAQAIAIDKHFAMEQTVRHRANLFPKFNGAGGVWRRRCLEDAGGWEADTVCEDLCLSTRAILKGWHFLFLKDVVAQAELPTSIVAYKNQQARWAKGSSQCLLKYGRSILTDANHSPLARLYALLSMSAYNTHFLVLLLLLLQIPMILLDIELSPKMLIFSIAGVGQPILFVLAQQVLHGDWFSRLRHFPTMVLISIGIGPNTSRSILEIAFRQEHPFLRTPKFGSQPIKSNDYLFQFNWIILVELLLAIYSMVGLALAFYLHHYSSFPFLLTCTAAFSYVSFLGLRESLRPFSKQQPSGSLI